ncbi:MAG: hypothetical protein L6408_05775 [Nanoarchaeota archaeon]|nr:hypothetical protein [Nanoarchaeota archaeon]
MRLTQEVTEDLLKEVAGEDTIKLVGLLKGKDNVSEFKLAEKLRLTVNTVRNMLYRLEDHNLVSSIRKKDQKKGWYIYYWTFNDSQAKMLSRAVKQKKLLKLKEVFHIESQETFYVCPGKCTRFKQENAMDYEFKCPECGTLLDQEDNTEFLETIKAKVLELEEELAKPLIEVRKKKTKISKGTKKVKRAQPKKGGRVKRAKPKVGKLKRIKSNLRLKKLKVTKKVKRANPKKVKRTKTARKRLKSKRPKLRIRVVKKVKRKSTRKKVIKKKPAKKKIVKKKVVKKKAVKKAKPKKKSVLKKVKRFLRRK